MDLLTNLSLFSGAGGLDLGAKFVGGFRTVGYVEFDPYAQGVLMSRIRDGQLDDAPIWDDVKTFDGRPFRGLVDVVSGGFPCQDVSFAGKRLAGDRLVEGTRSGLWSEFARIILEVGPRFVLVENVPGLLTGGLGDVLGKLAAMGFDAKWEVFSAADAGAPHLRERVWVIADRQGIPPRSYTDFYGWDTETINKCRSLKWGTEFRHKQERQPGSLGGDVADAAGLRRGPSRGDEPGADGAGQEAGQPLAGGKGLADPGSSGLSQLRVSGGIPPETGGRTSAKPKRGSGPRSQRTGWWSVEPPLGRVANGVAYRVDSLRLCGNGVVPQQAAPAWEKIKELARRANGN